MENIKIFLAPNTKLLLISNLILPFEQDFHTRLGRCLEALGSSWAELSEKAHIASQTINNWKKPGGGPRNRSVLQRLATFTQLPLHVIRAAALLDFSPEERVGLLRQVRAQ